MRVPSLFARPRHPLLELGLLSLMALIAVALAAADAQPTPAPVRETVSIRI